MLECDEARREVTQLASSYLIRNIPSTLHQAAKLAAKWRGISLRQLILEALADHVKRTLEEEGLLEGSNLEETESQEKLQRALRKRKRKAIIEPPTENVKMVPTERKKGGD